MEIITILVTPDIAREWLEKFNTNNRPLQPAHSTFLANQMRGGKWMETGDSIKFGENGQLIDGQHRLLAVVRSGISQSFVVAREVQNEAFQVVDSGKKRTSGDVLCISGLVEGNPDRMKNLSGAVRLAMGKRRRGGINGEILRFVQDNQFVCKQAVSLFDEMPSNWRKVVRPAALLAAFILISKKGVPAVPVKQWMFHFTSGVGLSLFQTRLRDNLISMSQINPEVYNPRAIWILVTAWNASCTNKISGIFKQPATWETPEAIVPQGLQFQQATP